MACLDIETLRRSPKRFINRELSWLRFNTRVLDEARNRRNPLLEKIRFLSISSSNLDEFFMVRVAGLKSQVSHQVTSRSKDGLLPSEQLEEIALYANKLMKNQQKIWLNLKEQLKKEQIHILSQKDLSKSERQWLREYFMKRIFPVLSPIAVDPAHLFPFLPNLGLAVICELKKKKGFESHLTIIPFPLKLERFIALPQKENGSQSFVLIEDIIALCSDVFFPERTINSSGLMRITRDSEIEIEEEAEDLVGQFESAVKQRRRGGVIRLEVNKTVPSHIRNILTKEFDVTAQDIIEHDALVDLTALSELYDYCQESKLKFEPYIERSPERVSDFGGDCFAAIAKKDFVVHHPYETFDVVVNFLHQAARDPDVIAIKQTLYRTSKDSPIVKALIEAAEAGKSVTVMVELKARFDEEANIRWARDLERVGAQVVFGVLKLKTHAKVSLVVRRENGHLQSYAHFGTGNYHPVTARTYVDLSYFTCDDALCADAAYLFNFLTGYSYTDAYQKLIVSPFALRDKLVSLIDQEIAFATAGKPASIWVKLNALIDPIIIDKLYQASQVGVKIDLVVRGICGLRPGIKGLSENITVKSIVGRFLEHARIVCFGNGEALPSRNAKVFISSADWMRRNFEKRIEVMVPIENPTVHEQIMGQIMLANLKDRTNGWLLNSEGEYTRIKSTNNDFSAHHYFMTNPSLSGRGKALSEHESDLQRKKIEELG